MGGAQGAWRDTYEIVEEIGEGAVAKVYSATHRDTGQLVAVKVMRREIAQVAEDRERFRREAVAISEIDSPHVCAVYDFDTAGDEVYMVMEFVQGPTLRHIIKTFPWTVSDIGNVIGQVGEALYAAHQRGIVHRDLKPENIVLTGTGLARQVKVLDFGFAKLLEAEKAAEVEELTQIGAIFGTPQYMSPEQVMGKPVTPQCDLFALGVIAYEIAVGQRPWSGSSPHEVMVGVATRPPPPIEAARCDLVRRRSDLEAFFDRALHKDPDQRFCDAHELCRSLNIALGLEVSAALEDPNAWIEEVTQVGLFDGAMQMGDHFDEDTSVDTIEERLHATWHPVDRVAETVVDSAYAKTIPSGADSPHLQELAHGPTIVDPPRPEQSGVPRLVPHGDRSLTAPIARRDVEKTGGRLLYIALGVAVGFVFGLIVLLWLR